MQISRFLLSRGTGNLIAMYSDTSLSRIFFFFFFNTGSSYSPAREIMLDVKFPLLRTLAIMNITITDSAVSVNNNRSWL